MKSVLTIAGSDSSGGAGIQADIKTIQAHHLFAQSAITALTAQNTTGVYGVFDVPAQFVTQQIDVVFDDIRPDAVKIGMVSISTGIGGGGMSAVACARSHNVPLWCISRSIRSSYNFLVAMTGFRGIAPPTSSHR